jgi:hypothetical protein
MENDLAAAAVLVGYGATSYSYDLKKRAWTIYSNQNLLLPLLFPHLLVVAALDYQGEAIIKQQQEVIW